MSPDDELPVLPSDRITLLLRRLVVEDQWDRDQHLPPAVLASKDSSRRRIMDRVLDEVTELTPEQLGMVALLLHHGVDARDAVLAHLAACAAVMDGDATSRWLVGATFDRLMHRLGLPQALGTQQLPGILCRVSNGRLLSVDPDEGIDLPAESPSGRLPEGEVTLFGQKQTRSPIRDDVPAALLRALLRDGPTA
ncbi:MAG TPA: hypothetical protein VFP72_03640 [Kineosporiaceae bacterium]|nr:hypothetical protein [Kineosporiaceae bacterium]